MVVATGESLHATGRAAVRVTALFQASEVCSSPSSNSLKQGASSKAARPAGCRRRSRRRRARSRRRRAAATAAEAPTSPPSRKERARPRLASSSMVRLYFSVRSPEPTRLPRYALLVSQMIQVAALRRLDVLPAAERARLERQARLLAWGGN